MPKNLLKRKINFPRNLQKDEMYLKHGYIWKTELDSVSVHFNNQTCDFYIFLEQLPEYIIEKTKIYQTHHTRTYFGDNSKSIILAKSVGELEKKIKDLFLAYIVESSDIKKNKKIAIKFYNGQFEKELNISIKYTVFIEKVYFNEDGEISKIVNVKDDNGSYDSEIKNIDGIVYDYTEELEDAIKEIQGKLNESMDLFISKLDNSDSILELVKDSQHLLEQK